MRWGAAFVFGLLIMLLMPGFVADVVRSSGRYGPSLGLGALALVATPILALIACVTIIGLAAGIATFLLWALAIYAAQVFVGAWLGQKLLGESAGKGAILSRLAVGLLVIRVFGMVPIVRGLVWLLVIVWGLGALTLAIYNRVRTTPAAVVA